MAKRSSSSSSSSNTILLPEDILLYEILPRLPARSLGRCMSVCKQWLSFLTSPAFTKMHFNIINNNQSRLHPKVLVVSATKKINHFYTMDCETPEVEVGLSANRRPLPFGNNNCMTVISSLNGLVCVGTYERGLYAGHDYLDIFLWNPLTGDYKTMMTQQDDILLTRGHGLYYSSCDDDYKLLRVTQYRKAYIYSWKSDTWRKAKSRVMVDPRLMSWSDGCLVNGKLYFVAKLGLFRCRDTSPLIIRFDTKTETFTEIATPTPRGECYYMTVVEGCIHLSMFPKTDSDGVELWKMSMDHDGQWVKVIRSCMSLYDYHPLHLMKNGNWLLSSIHSVNVFKKEGEDLKKACEHTVDSTMLIHYYRGKFVETLVKT